jgi:hypothetical protein
VVSFIGHVILAIFTQPIYLLPITNVTLATESKGRQDNHVSDLSHLAVQSTASQVLIIPY